jgi:hypothetical protein
MQKMVARDFHQHLLAELPSHITQPVNKQQKLAAPPPKCHRRSPLEFLYENKKLQGSITFLRSQNPM